MTMKKETPQRVLVVDDEEESRLLGAKVAALEGAEATLCASAEEALDLLERERFDLLMTDLNLPGINGLELARVARGMHRGMPVLLVTGYASVGSGRQAAAQGVVDYVIKPVIVDELCASVRRALRLGAELRDSLRAGPSPAATAGRTPIPSSDAKTAQLPTLRRPADWPGQERLAEPVAERERRLSVMVVHPDDAHRAALSALFTSLGHQTVSFPDAARAGAHARRTGFDLLVAGPDVLQSRPDWLRQAGGRRPLGAVAIMERLGMDKVIEAIQLGARGLVAPPFERDVVLRDLEIALGQMLDDAESLV
jgi:DNA-binding NtrC family response regulator